MTAQVILAVDSNQRNLELLSQLLTKEGYSMRLVSNLEEFAAAIEQPDEIGLALVDISGFDRRIWGYCEQLANYLVPLLVISPQRLAQIQHESISHGAKGVLYKPLVVKELTNLIRSMMRDDLRE
jgi:DNA-binding response OmpR family regulator